jgi:hypothetical protein
VHCLTCAASQAGADPGTLLTQPFTSGRKFREDPVRCSDSDCSVRP